jgi:hypothetical protein
LPTRQSGSFFLVLQLLLLLAIRQFRVSRPAISKFTPEVCDDIYNALQEFIKVRKTYSEELIDIFQTVLIMENPQRKRLWIRMWLARRNTHGAP